MKRFFFSLFVFLFALSRSNAQFYLKPYAGIGLANVHEIYPLMANYPTSSAVAGYTGVIGVGYRFNHRWSLETGIGYVRTGRAFSSMLYQGLLGITDLRIAQQHIVLPVRAALRIPLANNLSLNPSLGVQLSYNAGATAIVTFGGRKFSESVDDVHETFKPFGLFGETQLHLAYAIDKQWEVFAGPSFQYMLTSVAENGSSLAFYEVKEHPYAAMLQAGVNIYFAKPKPRATPTTR